MHNVVDTQSGNHLGGQHGIDRLKLPQNYFIFFFTSKSVLTGLRNRPNRPNFVHLVLLALDFLFLVVQSTNQR